MVVPEEAHLDHNHIQSSKAKALPFIFRLVCLVSLIGGAFWLIIYFSALLGLKPLFNPFEPNDAHLFSGLAALPMILFTGLSIAGVFQMWKFKKAGFYLYFIAQFLLFNYPLLVYGTNLFDLNELFFTTIFILFYGIILAIQKK